MRTRLPLRALGVVLLAACGGSPPTGGGSPADPQDVASVRLFNSGLGELTFFIPLFPGDTLPVEVRMYAANGSQIVSVTGGERSEERRAGKECSARRRAGRSTTR